MYTTKYDIREENGYHEIIDFPMLYLLFGSIPQKLVFEDENFVHRLIKFAYYHRKYTYKIYQKNKRELNRISRIIEIKTI